MDESYMLKVQPFFHGNDNANRINVTIRANTFFGARHALETLTQLFVYDDIRDHLLVSLVC